MGAVLQVSEIRSSMFQGVGYSSVTSFCIVLRLTCSGAGSSTPPDFELFRAADTSLAVPYSMSKGVNGCKWHFYVVADD